MNIEGEIKNLKLEIERINNALDGFEILLNKNKDITKILDMLVLIYEKQIELEKQDYNIKLFPKNKKGGKI